VTRSRIHALHWFPDMPPVAAAPGITVYAARQKWTYARAWLGDVLGR
jgi:hypothetical protein